MSAFAVFVVAPVRGGIAATTRAADRGEAGKIGLPGGKVDKGESEQQAAIREAKEEGWSVIGVESTPYYTAKVEGRTVSWFKATGAIELATYKEQGRISTMVASISEISASGYGNDRAMAEYLRITK